MSRDEIIRIILEVKDRGSAAVRNFEKNVNQSIGKVRQDYRNLDTDEDRFSRRWRRQLADETGSVKLWSGSIKKELQSVQNFLKRTRSEFEKTNIAFGKVERGPGGRFQSVSERQQAERETQGPGPIRSFVEGLRQAREVEEAIRSRTAQDPKDLKQKRLILDSDIARLREIEIQFANIVRETTAKIIEEQKAALKDRIRIENEAEAARELQRKEHLQRDILAVQEKFDEKRIASEERQRVAIEKRQQKFLDDQVKREKQLLKDQEAVRASQTLTPAARRRELLELRQAARQAQADAIRQRRADIREIELAEGRIRDENQASRDAEITKLEAANANERKKDSDATDKRIAKEAEATKERIDALNNQTSSDLRARRQEFEAEQRNRRIQLSGGNEVGAVRSALNERDLRNAEQDTNRVSAAFRNAGNNFGDLVRGIRRGRGDFRELSKDAREADTAFSRFGQTIGRFTKNIGNLVNLRWYLIISAIQILGQLVLILAANLISLASSAAIAAAALGAGLVAAASQALPVVGLLAAAFSRVGAAFTASSQAQKANAQSSQDARAQAEAQTAAQQRLSDAIYAQVQAVHALADARRQARRDIVDSINAEIDANYALKDAEFAVLDAKQRLRDLENQNRQDQQAVKDAEAQVKEAKERLEAAKKEGDQAEIENAQAQLAIAQQNLADAKGQEQNSKDRKRQIDEQKLAVKEAEQQLKEAKIAQRRQEEDTARTVRLGVKGNQAVVDALHGVAQANREVANAQRGVTDASKKQAAAGNVLQQQLSQLDPAEKALYRAFRSLRDQFKKTFSPVTDIIVNAVTDAVKRVTKAIQDPEIVKGFTGLAKAVAKGISDLSKFFTSRGFLHDFAGFIHEATSNIPTVIKIIENLAKAFLGLAKAGQPIVKDLLGRFANLTGRFSKAINEPVGQSPTRGQDIPGRGSTTGQTRGQQFIASAKTYLDSWIKLAEAIGRVFKYLIGDAAPAGNNLVNALTNMFNNLADFLRDNPQKVDAFFQRMFQDLKRIAGVLFPLVKVLLTAFTGENATAFTQFTAQVVLPGIAALIQFLGLLARFALFLSHIPGIKFFLQLLVFEKTMNRIFPATQRVTDVLKKLTFFLLKLPFSKIAREQVGFFIFRLKYFAQTAIPAAIQAVKLFARALIENLLAAFRILVTFIAETLIPAIGEAASAMLAFFVANPILLAIAAIVGALVVLELKFHIFEKLWHWIKDNWRKLLGWLVYPFVEAWKGIKWALDKVRGLVGDLIGWIKHHWKILAAILIAIFIPGGLLLLAVFKWKDKMLSVAKDVVYGIANFFKRLPHLIYEALKKLPHLILDLFKDLGKKIFSEIFSFLPGPIRSALGKAFHLAGSAIGGIKSGLSSVGGFIGSHLPATGGVIGESNIPRGSGPHGTDTVHAWLTPGEWVLNKTQQMKLAQRLGETSEQVSAYLFGTNRGQGRPSQVTRKRGGKQSKVYPYKLFNLVSQNDDNGNTVWFIELDDGSFAEVTKRDARKIQSSHGNFIPKYVKRARDSSGNIIGFTQAGQRWLKKHGLYSRGGIVSPTFAMGGVVTSPQNAYGASSISNVGGNIHHKKIEQNFNVSTQGETDWNYVMRLAAMHAQGSF